MPQLPDSLRQVVIAVALLFYVLGLSALGGVAFMIIGVPLGKITTIRTQAYQKILMKRVDERMSVIGEAMQVRPARGVGSAIHRLGTLKQGISDPSWLWDGGRRMVGGYMRTSWSWPRYQQEWCMLPRMLRRPGLWCVFVANDDQGALARLYGGIVSLPSKVPIVMCPCVETPTWERPVAAAHDPV